MSSVSSKLKSWKMLIPFIYNLFWNQIQNMYIWFKILMEINTTVDFFCISYLNMESQLVQFWKNNNIVTNKRLNNTNASFNCMDFYLTGGFLEFSRLFPGLCEGKSTLVPSCMSQPCLPVTNIGPTRILPHLYLGCQRDVLNKVHQGNQSLTSAMYCLQRYYICVCRLQRTFKTRIFQQSNNYH